MQEHVRLILACPNCGCTEWISNEDGDYVCVSCGNVDFPENMCAHVEENNYGSRTNGSFV